jgi:acyl-CoA reductase-like NAD-dependent aldehyde dehydrogenase
MTYCTINPANERLLQEFAEQNDVQVGEILTRANTAFRDDWSRRPLRDRRIVLKTAASFLRQDREHFARLVTLDMGKRLDEARPRSISVLTSQLLRRTTLRRFSLQRPSPWTRATPGSRRPRLV